MKIEVAGVNSAVVSLPCHLLFIYLLVLLPLPCEALAITLTAEEEASLSSPLNFHLYSSPVSALLQSSFLGTQVLCSPCPHSVTPPLSLSSLQCLTPAPVPPPALISCSLHPTTAQLQPSHGSRSDLGFFLLLLPLPPASHLLFSPHNGFCSLPAAANVSSVPHPQLLWLTSAPRAACFSPLRAQPAAASTDQSTMLKSSLRG